MTRFIRAAFLRIRLFCPTVLCVAWFFISGPAVYSQLNGRIAERPIGVGYLRDVTQVRVIEYVRSLSERIDIGKTMFSQIPTEQVEAIQSKVEHPVNGVAWYMVQGLLPSFTSINFQEVIDLTDAKRMLEAQNKMMGGTGTIETVDAVKFRMTRVNSWTMDVPEGMEADAYSKQISSQNFGGSGSTTTARVVEVDGVSKVEQTWTNTQYYRFYDQMLFNAAFEDLWTMNLPTRDSLTSSVQSTNDMGMEAFFDRIPTAIKMLGWNMLNSGVGTQMQQRDDEDPTITDLRKTGLELGLSLIKACMFDIDECHGWLRFATDSQQSLRGELNFRTRRNSQLTAQLQQIASAHSRFAPVLNDSAAATLHTCFQVSKDSVAVLTAAANWQQKIISDSTNADPTLTSAAAELAQTLNDIAEHRNVELLLKAGWTPESGGVIYGGLQVHDNPNLLRALHTLMINAPDAREAISFSDTDGRQLLQIALPPPAIAYLQLSSGLNLSHIYIVHQNSCLWFAIGGKNALQIIRQSVARCEAVGLAAQTPLLTADLDADRWLSYPQDDETGIGGLLTRLDSTDGRFPPSPFGDSFGAFQRDVKPTPLLQKVFAVGGERTARFTVIGDKSGVRASLQLGEAIANYYVARLIDGQDRMMSGQAVEAPPVNASEVPEETEPIRKN